mgnify:FL=1|jgi:hypothetical protein|nr:MAG TPA: hypothetical protein [Caudoviricetes sp.]
MLSKEEKVVVSFIRECRNQLMNKDELHIKRETMYSKLAEFESLVKNNTALNKIFLDLEDLVIDTLYLTEETFFEYGSCHSTVIENQNIDDVIAG